MTCVVFTPSLHTKPLKVAPIHRPEPHLHMIPLTKVFQLLPLDLTAASQSYPPPSLESLGLATACGGFTMRSCLLHPNLTQGNGIQRCMHCYRLEYYSLGACRVSVRYYSSLQSGRLPRGMSWFLQSDSPCPLLELLLLYSSTAARQHSNTRVCRRCGCLCLPPLSSRIHSPTQSRCLISNT
jgi:hypothetical protein